MTGQGSCVGEWWATGQQARRACDGGNVVSTRAVMAMGPRRGGGGRSNVGEVTQ